MPYCSIVDTQFWFRDSNLIPSCIRDNLQLIPAGIFIKPCNFQRRKNRSSRERCPQFCSFNFRSASAHILPQSCWAPHKFTQYVSYYSYPLFAFVRNHLSEKQKVQEIQRPLKTMQNRRIQFYQI